MPGFLRALPILIASLYAVAMGLIVLGGRQALPPGTLMVQDPGPYITTGIVLVGVLMSFQMQERRIQGLEQRLQKLDAAPERAVNRGAE